MKKLKREKEILKEEIEELESMIADCGAFPAESADIQREEIRSLLSQLKEKRTQLYALNQQLKATATSKGG